MFDKIGVICFFISFFFKKCFKKSLIELFFVNVVFLVIKFFKVVILVFEEISLFLKRDFMFVGILNMVFLGIGSSLLVE